MKTFDKSSKLEHVAYDIRGPVLDEANRMIAKGEKILRLNTGNPAEFGFTAPDEVIRDLIMNVRNSEGLHQILRLLLLSIRITRQVLFTLKMFLNRLSILHAKMI